MPNDLQAHHTTLEVKPTETQIQSAIMGFLRYKGYYVQRMNSGALRDQHNRLIRMNKAGTPDLMAFRKPSGWSANDPTVKLLFIEVKRPGNRPTPLQHAVMQELAEHGALCIVAHSVEEVKEAIT